MYRTGHPTTSTGHVLSMRSLHGVLERCRLLCIPPYVPCLSWPCLAARYTCDLSLPGQSGPPATHRPHGAQVTGRFKKLDAEGCTCRRCLRRCRACTSSAAPCLLGAALNAWRSTAACAQLAQGLPAHLHVLSGQGDAR